VTAGLYVFFLLTTDGCKELTMRTTDSSSNRDSAACSPEGQTGSIFTPRRAVTNCRPQSHFANLPDWSVTKRVAVDSFAAEAAFEDSVVFYLLKHYGLDKAKAKFIIRDYDRSAGGDDSPSLTLFNFKQLFPDYPISLSVGMLSKFHASRLTVPKLFNQFTETKSLERFQEWIDDCGGPAGFRAQMKNRPEGYVIGWPNVFPAESLVLHGLLPVNPNVIGTHMLINQGDGVSLMLQPLAVFLESLDSRFPKRMWLATASHTDFDERWEKSDAATVD
jgi:hypothetical protein